MKFQKTILTIILIIVIIAIIGAVFIYTKAKRDISNNDKNNTNNAQEINNDSNDEDATYKLGETGVIDGVKVTINKVENYTDETKKPKDGNKFIKVNITIENTNNADRGIVSSDFQCLVDGKQASLVSIDSTNRLKSSALNANKTVSGDLYYEVNASASKYEIDYNYDDIAGLILKFSI